MFEKRDQIYRIYLDFLNTAEKRRRWSLFDDIPWNNLNPAHVTATVGQCVELFCAEEMYVPDYSAVGLEMVRSTFGMAWFQTLWAFEESKHALVFREYLTRSGLLSENAFETLQTGVFAGKWQLPFQQVRQMVCYGAQQKHPILPARPSRGSDCPEESFDLGAGEEVDGPFLGSLGRHRQHLLAVMEELRFIAGDILEERMDRRQPRVAAARAVAAPGFDEHQEAPDQIRIDIGDLERSRRPPEAIAGVFQEQAKGVAVAGDRVRAGMKLGRTAFGKELLHIDRKRIGLHRASLPARFRSARSQASCRSARLASMYQ